MKNIQFLFLGLAIATVLAMGSIGIAIAEESVLGIISSVIATILIMGFSFAMKKRNYEANKKSS